MRITLQPKDEDVIAHAIRTGAYRTPEEVVERALEMLHEEEQWLETQKDAIAEKIERGLADFDRGDFLSSSNSRADMERRKAEWFRERSR